MEDSNLESQDTTNFPAGPGHPCHCFESASGITWQFCEDGRHVICGVTLIPDRGSGFLPWILGELRDAKTVISMWPMGKTECRNFLKRFYLFFLERGEGMGKERERNVDV